LKSEDEEMTKGKGPGWPGDPRRHYEAKVFGKASPRNEFKNPVYSHKHSQKYPICPVCGKRIPVIKGRIAQIGIGIDGDIFLQPVGKPIPEIENIRKGIHTLSDFEITDRETINKYIIGAKIGTYLIQGDIPTATIIGIDGCLEHGSATLAKFGYTEDVGPWLAWLKPVAKTIKMSSKAIFALKIASLVLAS